ncbi:DUF2520 domain-containing protein [Mucilaginibacter koreensis]
MRITIIGSGNVATHLAAAFKNAGHRLVQIYSRNLQHASLLAYHVNAEAVDDLSQITANTDLFIIAVKDDVITAIAGQLAHFNRLMVHTSGAVPLSELLAVNSNAGIFYPLQTFSKTKEVNFWEVPLCIEGADNTITESLTELARTISNNVYQVDSAQRKILHLAAVFACNFPNYLYHIAQNLLGQHQLDFNLIRPLISETAAKVQEALPAEVQTGPAIREDESTMAAHVKLLEKTPELQLIYTMLSQGIIKMK